MPHSVTCGACKATFSIPDEVWDKRVHGQVATLKCRHCKSPIEVDGRVRRGSAVSINTSTDAIASVAHTEPKPSAVSAPAASAEGQRHQEPAPQPAKPAEPAKIEAKAAEPAAAQVQSASTAQGGRSKEESLDAGRFEVKQPEMSATAKRIGDSADKSAGPTFEGRAGVAATKRTPASPLQGGMHQDAASLTGRKTPERSQTRPALPSNVTLRAAQEGTPKPKPAAQRAEAKSSPGATEPQRDSSELWVVSFGADDDRELTTSQLQDTISKGQVTRETIVWREGMHDWLPIGKIPELAHSFKPEPAAQPLSAPKPAALTDDGDDETIIYKPGSKIAAVAAASSATSPVAAARPTPSAAHASPGTAKSTLTTAAKPEAAAPRGKAAESASDARGAPPFRPQAKSAPSLTGGVERTRATDEASPKPPALQRSTADAQGAKVGGGPPPLRRAQPSRPENALGTASPWPTQVKSSAADEIVTSVPQFEPARAAAAPPPLPAKEKIETPVAKPAIFPPPVQTAQAFTPVTDVAPHSLRATPSFAPRPSDIAALVKIRPKFPKWLPFAVLGGLVALVALFAALSWFAGDNPEGADRKAAPDDSGPLPGNTSSSHPGTSVAASAPKDDKASGGDLSAGFANKFAQAAAKQRPTARFDRDAAEKALAPGFAKAAGCHNKGEPTGTANVTISISPSGQVLSVTVAPPFSTTFTAECIRSALREISVPPFQGSPGRLAHSITIH